MCAYIFTFSAVLLVLGLYTTCMHTHSIYAHTHTIYIHTHRRREVGSKSHSFGHAAGARATHNVNTHKQVEGGMQ